MCSALALGAVLVQNTTEAWVHHQLKTRRLGPRVVTAPPLQYAVQTCQLLPIVILACVCKDGITAHKDDAKVKAVAPSG